jgi:predicted Rossmann fold flavoprotein
MKRVVVIGGGAAGFMAAIRAAERGLDVTVLERNERPLRKVMITGKGRCNVTNNTDLKGLVDSVTGDGRFLYSAFNGFSAYDTMDFFESNGVPLKTERGNRVFPKSDKAVDIVDALCLAAKRQGVKILQKRVTAIDVKDSKVSGVATDLGERIPADSVVIATGGLSYPLTGSTGDGYKFAESLGHSIVPTCPSLVPVTAKEGWCSNLQGLSLKNVSCTVYKGEKAVYSDFGELMFTHYGLSGPIILSTSAYIKNPEQGGYKIVIDLKPALDEKTLDERILRDFGKYSNKDFINSLCDLLPRKMVPVIVKLSGIEPSAKVNQITKTERENLVKLFKSLTLNINGFRPIEEAVITKGGIKLSEVDPKTMQSKLVNGLFFAGEVLDVDAFTGGFNLQIAFSTGYAAGNSV